MIASLLLWEHVRANLGPRGAEEPILQYAGALATAQHWTGDCRLAASSASLSWSGIAVQLQQNIETNHLLPASCSYPSIPPSKVPCTTEFPSR